MTLGLDLHNPFNLEDYGIKWQGLVPTSHPPFCQFESDLMGLRAGFKDIYNQGKTTIKDFITKYAPAKDKNNVPAYISSVTAYLEVDQNTIVDMQDRIVLLHTGIALITHEQGSQPFSVDLLNRAIDLVVGDANGKTVTTDTGIIGFFKRLFGVGSTAY